MDVRSTGETIEQSDPAGNGGLRILAADEDRAALGELAEVLGGLGHRLPALAVSPDEVARAVAERDPDLALVKIRDDEERGLALIAEIAEYASEAVLALLDVECPHIVAAAGEKGIFAYVRPLQAETVQGAIVVAIRRHADT